MLDISEIKDISSEAGIIATIIINPEYTFYSEQLDPHQFVEPQNAYIYWAIRELAKRGIKKIDAYNITNMLNMHESTKKQAELMTIQAINELIDCSKLIARGSIEEYNLLVSKVLDLAERRDTYKTLSECSKMCLNTSEDEIQQKIYSALDTVSMKYASVTEVPQYKDVVDSYWDEIVERQNTGSSGIPFKFNTLNAYATIEPGELFIFAADAKIGKSMMLLNCAVDLLKQDKAVLYIDSELNSRMFTCRLISHLTNIEFSRVKSGRYAEVEEQKIHDCIAWLKKRKFTHLYMPMFDAKTIYTAVKRAKHSQGLDVLIVD